MIDTGHAQTGAAKTGISPSRSAGRLAARLVLSLGSLVAMFLVAELCLRLAGAKPQTVTALPYLLDFADTTGWAGIPLARSRFASKNFDVVITHTAEGLRTCGLHSKVAADTNSTPETVWCLGDSQTWGWGVADGETWVDRLNQLGGGRRRFRNLGVCGFSSVQEFLLLKDFFQRGDRPAEVVVLFCGNDLAENFNAGDPDPLRPHLQERGGRLELTNYPVPPVRDSALWHVRVWMNRNSLAYHYARFYLRTGWTAWKSLRDGRAGGNADQTFEPAEAPSPAEIAGLQFAYREMGDLCAQNGVRLAVAAWEPDSCAVVRQVCDQLQIPVLDLSRRRLEYFASDKRAAIRFPTDPHFNAFGHRLIAAAIHDELARLDALRPTSGPLTSGTGAAPH